MTVAFPLNTLQDSSKYNEALEDVALRNKMEGGYVYTRPKFTRNARKTFITGFTEITNEEKLTLEAFWQTVKGGSDIFTWVNPVMSTTHNVRFTKPISFKYAGIGNVHRWNVDGLELEEV